VKLDFHFVRLLFLFLSLFLSIISLRLSLSLPSLSLSLSLDVYCSIPPTSPAHVYISPSLYVSLVKIISINLYFVLVHQTKEERGDRGKPPTSSAHDGQIDLLHMCKGRRRRGEGRREERMEK